MYYNRTHYAILATAAWVVFLCSNWRAPDPERPHDVDTADPQRHLKLSRPRSTEAIFVPNKASLSQTHDDRVPFLIDYTHFLACSMVDAILDDAEELGMDPKQLMQYYIQSAAGKTSSQDTRANSGASGSGSQPGPSTSTGGSTSGRTGGHTGGHMAAKEAAQGQEGLPASPTSTTVQRVADIAQVSAL